MAVADISKNSKRKYLDIAFKGVKFFSDIREMYDALDIDLTIVASHAGLHSSHACAAMENDSHVFIMKPLAGSLEDAKEIEHFKKITGKKVLVGYETIYNDAIIKLKEIILSGYLGGLIDMKMICHSPKPKSYFSSNPYLGKVCDEDGRLINSSVANNDAANYFLNLLYFAGAKPYSTGKIERIEAKLFRTNDIETFDTCSIKAELEGEIGMLAIASQATSWCLTICCDLSKIIHFSNKTNLKP